MAGPVLVVGKVYLAEIFGTGPDNQQVINRYWIDCPVVGAGPNKEMSNLSADLGGWHTLQQIPLLMDTYRRDFIRIRRVLRTPAGPLVLPTLFDEQFDDVNFDRGDVVGTNMPTSIGINMTLKTTIPGRRYRGRKNFAPISTLDLESDGNLLTNVTKLAWQAVGDTMIIPSVLADFTWQFGVYSAQDQRQSVPYGPNAFSFYSKLTSARVQKYAGSQNTRKPRNTAA